MQGRRYVPRRCGELPSTMYAACECRRADPVLQRPSVAVATAFLASGLPLARPKLRSDADTAEWLSAGAPDQWSAGGREKATDV